MDFMNMGVVRFTLLFFVFHAVTSHDDSQMSSIIQEILKEYNIENNTFEHEENLNLSSINFIDFQGDEKLKLHCEKLRLSHRLFENLIVISKLRTNTTKKFVQMLNEIDEFRSTLYQSLQEETQPLLFDEFFERFGFEDVPRFDLTGYQSNEFKKLTLQLHELKSKVIEWANDIQSEIEKSADLSTSIHKFSQNEDIPEEPYDELIIKDSSLPKSEDDDEDTPAEKFKIFSTNTDEKNEEWGKTEGEKYVNKEMYAQSLLNEETLPRWVPTIKDMEEIRDKYVKWMTLFEKSEDTRIKSLKESLIDDGQSIKMFCRTLAEYFNTVGIIQECESKGDTECEEIMKKVLEQPHLKKFIEFFTAWGSS
ncbi:uncharacterized protein LOC135835210 [Planococcus citri]|uniref:uncharacterized protein LOC135835210 n=1 Tax=Planococcus citri TaxID=170843 RepID=UPI0031F7FF9E